LITNGGRVSNVEPMVVRENDDYETTEASFRHTYDPFAPREKRGEMIGAYVRMSMPTSNGTEIKTVIMSKEQILEVAGKSRSYQKGVGPWHGTETDQEEMWKKTVIIRACKTLPLNAKQQEAIQKLQEQDGSIIEARAQPIKRGLKETLRVRRDHSESGDLSGSVLDSSDTKPQADTRDEEARSAPREDHKRKESLPITSLEEELS
jgi:recombinational DNA repair protein RecT